MRRPARLGLVAVIGAVVALPLAAGGAQQPRDAGGTGSPTTPTDTPPSTETAPPGGAPAWPAVVWHHSRAAGLPWRGRLVQGVQLPVEGEHFFTWDPALDRVPDRGWRRWGTDRLVRTILEVLDGYAAANPLAPRVGIGDLSRPRGGPFGARFGGLGHASHQNGLDVDVYYPRLDARERAAYKSSQVDRYLAQALVDRFVAAGAQRIFVGPRVGLRGPHRIVQVLAHHDDHLHVRIRPR